MSQNNSRNPLNLKALSQRRGFWFAVILFMGLCAFETWNYISSHEALVLWFGTSAKFLGIQWATFLAFAFCAIDFAGLARIFTPQQGQDEPAEVWYLFGAWLIAAGFDAYLTYFTVLDSMLTNPERSILITDGNVRILSIAVAGLDFLTRLLLVNTFATAGERLFQVQSPNYRPQPYQSTNNSRPSQSSQRPMNVPGSRPAPRPTAITMQEYLNQRRNESTYHSVPSNQNSNSR